MHLAVVAGLSLSPIAKPIAAILAAIYSVVPNYGVAILVLSLGWMIVISPLTLKSTRSMLAMQKLQPQLNKLKTTHANDRQALSQATMDLYKENNVSPFGSCLPSLLPLPIFFALFRVIDGLSHTSTSKSGVVTATPKYLSSNTRMYRDIVAAGGHLNAFGLDLSKNILSSHSSVLTTAPYVLVLLIMMGTGYWQTASMINRNPASADNPQTKMLKYTPLIFGVICVRFPAGVIVYYAMSNICRVTQQGLMYRFDPKVRVLAADRSAAVDAEARDIEYGYRAREAQPDPTPSRGRFRDLLASQQQPPRGAKAPGRNGAGAATNGARNGAKPNGARPGGAKPAARANGAKPGVAKANGAKPTAAKAGGARTNGTNGAKANGTRTNGANGTKTNGTKTPAGAGTAGAAAAKSTGDGKAGAAASPSVKTPANPRGNGSTGDPAPVLAGPANGSGGDPGTASGNGNNSPNGGGAARPRTGANTGRTGASSGARANKKRRGN